MNLNTIRNIHAAGRRAFCESKPLTGYPKLHYYYFAFERAAFRDNIKDVTEKCGE